MSLKVLNQAPHYPLKSHGGLVITNSCSQTYPQKYIVDSSWVVNDSKDAKIWILGKWKWCTWHLEYLDLMGVCSFWKYWYDETRKLSTSSPQVARLFSHLSADCFFCSLWYSLTKFALTLWPDNTQFLCKISNLLYTTWPATNSRQTKLATILQQQLKSQIFHSRGYKLQVYT